MARGQALDLLLTELLREFPGLKLLPKEQVWHQRWIGILLRILTFGGQRSYLSSYTTTLGTRRIYLPSCWERLSWEEQYIILRHERVHLRQFRRYTFPGMAILYLLLPLPAGLSYFRMIFEREAYKESIRASKEMYGREAVSSSGYQEGIVQQFTSGAYGWMWPFPKQVRRWVRRIAQEEA